jgi:hypothetical protein
MEIQYTEAVDSFTYLVTELTRGNEVEKQRIKSAKKVHRFLLGKAIPLKALTGPEGSRS